MASESSHATKGGGGGGDQNGDAGGRARGVTIIKPIAYGNIARYFGSKRESDGHTHQWTLYIKPYQNEDFSGFVKKVTFKLHESYANSTRTVCKPPYEITETGWGEFEVMIKIHFVDANERPVTVYHLLKLFEIDPVSKAIIVKKNLISEFYDEVVFNEPSLTMYSLLNRSKQLTVGAYRHETDFEARKDMVIDAMSSAKRKVRREVDQLKDQLKAAQEAILKYREVLKSTEAQEKEEEEEEA